MDKQTQRELAAEIAKAHQKEKERRLGTGCLVLIAIIGIGALVLGTAINNARISPPPTRSSAP